MKKSILAFVLGVVSLGTVLQSCSGQPGDKSEAKEPKGMASAKVENQGSRAIMIQDLHETYEEATEAHFKYAAYSAKAKEEGYPEVALLFRATSGAELIQANNHTAVLLKMGELLHEITPEFIVKTSTENFIESIKGNSYQFNTKYPEFIANANIARNYMAQISFTYAYKVEHKHRDFYLEGSTALETARDNSLPKLYYLCPTCGNTYATTAPSRCEISMTDSKLFIKVMEQ